MIRCQPLMGTFVVVKIKDIGQEEQLTKDREKFYQYIISIVFSEMKQVQSLMSFHDMDSDVSRINQISLAKKYMNIEVHPWTLEVLQIAKDLFIQTGGSFDCGIGNHLMAWGLLPGQMSEEEYLYMQRSCLASILIENQAQIRLIGPVMLDLGGIAKGYAIDRGIQVLSRFGIERALINAGGDIRSLGPEQELISLRDVRDQSTYSPLGKIQDEALAVSSTSFCKKNIGNRHISHLVNPLSGQSIDDLWTYVVKAPSCVIADGLTKALAVDKDIHAKYFGLLKASAQIIRSNTSNSLM